MNHLSAIQTSHYCRAWVKTENALGEAIDERLKTVFDNAFHAGSAATNDEAQVKFFLRDLRRFDAVHFQPTLNSGN